MSFNGLGIKHLEKPKLKSRKIVKMHPADTYLPGFVTFTHTSFKSLVSLLSTDNQSQTQEVIWGESSGLKAHLAVLEPRLCINYRGWNFGGGAVPLAPLGSATTDNRLPLRRLDASEIKHCYIRTHSPSSWAFNVSTAIFCIISWNQRSSLVFHRHRLVSINHYSQVTV